MSRTKQPTPLLYDSVTVPKILSLSPDAIDRLCAMGVLRPSVTVGNRRLFSARDLERFANGSPRRINLHTGETAETGGSRTAGQGVGLTQLLST